MKVSFKPSDFTCNKNQFIDWYTEFSKWTDLNLLSDDIKKIVSWISYLVKKYSIDTELVWSLQELLIKADLIDDFEIWWIVTKVNCIINNTDYNFSSVSNYIEFLENIINSSSLVLRVDLEWNVKWANELFCEVSWYSLEELNWKSTKDLSWNFSDERPKEFWSNLWETIKLWKKWRWTIKNQRKTWEYYRSDTIIFPKKTKLWAVEEYYVVRTDVTESEDLKDRYMFQALTLEKVNWELTKSNTILSELALTDWLTWLYNRRSFDNRLNEVLSYASRAWTTFWLVLFDIDFFKKVNDIYWHDWWDLVLTNLANMLKIKLRADDFTARVWWEEFAIIICDTTKNGITEQIDRLRKNIEELTIKYNWKIINCTSSFGITLSTKWDSPTGIYKRADEALYKAKSNWRNRVEWLFI